MIVSAIDSRIMSESSNGPGWSDELERALTVLVRKGNLPHLHDRLARQAGIPLDRGGYGPLISLADQGEMRLSEMAEVLEVSTSTVSRHVRRLIQDGLVRSAGDPDDARASRLCLTPKGVKVLGKLRDARQRWVEEIVADWSAEDRKRLTELLVRFADDSWKRSPNRRA